MLITLLINFPAYSGNWKENFNAECSIKTNHPELLETKPKCSSWSSNYQTIQTYYLKNSNLLIYAKIQLAQPGYYWYNSGTIFKNLKQFNFIKDNVKFIKSNQNPVLSSNFWTKKPDNFDVEFNNLKFNNLKCFGFWDGSIDSASNIGKRHNLYGMICNLKGNNIPILKRKEFLNHIYINHKYVNTNPIPWTKNKVKNNLSNSTSSITLTPLEKSQSTCTDLGFSPKTEIHADCVMKMIDK